MMNFEENKKLLEKEIEKLRNSGILLIVEGKKDKQALEELGLKNIFVLNETGKSIYYKIEEIEHKLENSKKKECVILTDIDKKGRMLYLMLKKEFSSRGVKINGRIRELLIKLRVSHIEGLSTFLS